MASAQKILGLDVGEKRIGVATADTFVKIASPAKTLEVDGTELDEIAKLMRLKNTQFIVVGLPRNSKGEETAQSAYSRAFAKKLVGLGAKVKMQDESLTSVEAENRLKSRKKPYGKGDIDKEAAAIILQDFINDLTTKSPSPLVLNEPNTSIISHDGKKVKEKPEKTPKSPKKSHKKRNILICLTSFFVILLGIGVFGYFSYKNAGNAYNANCQENCERRFIINSGDSTKRILSNLESEDLIRSAIFLRLNLMISNDRPTFKSGAYILSQTMTPQQIFDILSGNTTYKTTFKFTPEKTIAETKANLLNFGYKSQEVDAAFSKIYNSPVLESKPEGAGLDGYLFIREYEFSPAVSVEGIINTCLGESYKIIIENDFASRNSLMHKFLAHDLTIHEALKKASESDKIIENPTLERLVAVAYPDSKIPFIMSGDYKAWLDFYGDLAKKVSNDSKYGGIPYEALLAQSILESSWGKSRLSYKHFNFFGIKYMNMPKNPLVAPSGFVSAETWEEYTPGEITVTTADFATWDSLEKGFLGYAAWIHNQPRYKEALKHSDDPIAYITALKKAGYATDSNYITIVTSIIETIRNLTKTST